MARNYARQIQHDNRFRFWVSLLSYLVVILLTARSPIENLLSATVVFSLYSAFYAAAHAASKRGVAGGLLQYALITADAAAITSAVYLTGVDKSPLYVLYVVLFGICIHHGAIADFVYTVVLSASLYGLLLFRHVSRDIWNMPVVAGQLLLMAILTGVLWAVLLMMARDRKDRERLIARAKATAEIADIMSSSVVSARDKARAICALIEREFQEDRLHCQIVVSKGDQFYMPPSGGKAGVHIPLMVGEKIFGTMALTFEKRRRPLKPDEHDFLASIAKSLAIALHRDRLWEDLQAQLEKVEAALLAQTVQAASFGRDPYEQKLLVDNMLEIVRMERGRWKLQKENCRFDDLLRTESRRIARLAAARNVIIRQDVTGAPSPVQGDESRLRIILANFLRHAVESASPGSEVAVESKNSGGEVTVLMRAQGKPLTEAEFNALFSEKLQPLEASAAADSLLSGLMIARQAVRAHGGRIWVESRGKDGHTLAFSIPHDLREDAALPSAQR